MTLEDLLTVADATKLDWIGGRGWRNALGRRTHQNNGFCEIDDLGLTFQRLPKTMQDEPSRYVYHIEQIVSGGTIDVIVGPAFASSEAEAKRKLLEALQCLLNGPSCVTA